MNRRGGLRPMLNLNLSQRLSMTPSLLQKIELLTLNQLELSDLLQRELEENPLLEEEAASENAEGDAEVKIQEAEADEKDRFKDLDLEDYENFFGEYLGANGQPKREFEAPDDRPTFEQFLASPTSLADYLNWQLNLSGGAAEVQEIAYFIIGNLDEDGYLTVSLEEIADTLRVTSSAVEEAVRVVQELDPVGVGSQDLQECLLLQIQALDLESSLVETLIRDHLQLIQAKKYKEVIKLLRCESEDFSEALSVIRTLSPRPGQKYSSREPVYVRPDVHFYKVGQEFEFALNDDGQPRLRLNRSYRNLLHENTVTKETKSFIRERFRAAVELLRSVDQRQRTIYRVCAVIVEHQRTFLDQGAIYLKPMLIKDVADELGVHPSTISRVVANKYAYTPQGVIELRKFFSVGVESADGENVSSAHVKERIKRIIEQENQEKPFSDQRIYKMLNTEGIQITRRTVAKYRDQMKVSGSRERKASNQF